MTRSRCIAPGATPNSSMSQLRLRRPSSKSTSSVTHSTPTFRRRGRCPGPTASATCAPWTAGGQESACATPLTMTPPRQRVVIARISLDEGRLWLVREGQAQLGRPAHATAPTLPAVTSPAIRSATFDTLSARTFHDIVRLRVDTFIVEQDCPYPELDGRDVPPSTQHIWVEDAGEVVS